MPFRVRSVRSIFTLCLAVALFVAPAALAQVTMGSIAGSVLTQQDGSALPGVTIEAIHVPTGTRYSAISGGDGRYMIPNARVGGPYKITATLEGFKTAEIDGVEVRLGASSEIPVKMALAAVAETITVTADVDPIVNPNRTGSSSAVSTTQIETLPTVNRSLQDFARTNPYFVVDSQDFSSTRVMVAGRNNRYNTIQVDGAVNNDLFGLADTGTPGGQTDSQPISLEAISQIQLVVSPYDVRQGGFTGGGINAVTRSGTNDLQGSIFYSERKPSLVGDGPLDRPIANFDQKQYGGRVGGRIIRDKLFFFASGEIGRKTAPTGVAADGSAPTNYNGSGTGSTPSASLVRDYLMSAYNFDPGSLGDYGAATDSDLALIKFDWSASQHHALSARYNYVKGSRDVAAERSSSKFRFDLAQYSIADKTSSTVLQLNSIFSANAFNEARVGYQTIRDTRDVPVIFPSVEIGGTGSRSGAINVGTERFSGANALDQDVLELTDDFTLLKGNHTFTFGTHNEFFDFKNLFLSEFYGYYYFKTLDDFKAGIVNEYRISFANGDDPSKPTQFSVHQYGLYASDQWRVNNKLSLTYGVRFDKPDWVDTPDYNPVVDTSIGFRTDSTPSDSVVVSPRIGFNWDPTGSATQQIRGGIGIFAGRTPYVWVSNAYGNTGIASTALACTGSCAAGVTFNPDPYNQPHSGGAGSSFSVDLVDPDFKMPRIIRGTLGYDRELPWDIRGTAEFVYSQNQEDVYYYNVNRVQNGVSPLDGRPTYTKVVTNIADAILLSNTSEGKEWVASLQLSKRIASHFMVTGNYAHQNAKSAFDGTSSRAISNWQFNHTKGDIFKPELSRGAFEIKDRFNFGVTYDVATGPFTHTIGLYYNAQTGRPYSVMMGGDPNTDGYSTNDLLYVPSNGVILCPNTAKTPTAASPCGMNGTNPIAALDPSRWTTYLESLGVNPNAGRILDRYEFTEPMSRELDLHYELGLPQFVGVGTQITFDVQNLANLIDKDYGVVNYVSNQNFTSVVWQGTDSTTKLPIYRENFNGSTLPGRQYSIADNRSRWQARLGLRLNF